MEDILYQYNPWWEETYDAPGLCARDRYLVVLKKHLPTRHIIFLTGLRRVGKTALMRLLIKRLLENGVPAGRILYVSVDDYVLRGRSLNEIIECFRRIHKTGTDDEIYLFFDEITSQPDYQAQLKSIYDRVKAKVFATSSSSSLLKDRKAMLTGRSFVFEIMPLDFEEYKIFRGINVKKRDGILNESHFTDYMQTGGLPENVLNPDRQYLMSLVDDIIQKDITAYHGLKNHQLLRDFFTLTMERSGKQFSINKIASILQISPDTARRFLLYFEETYLLHLLPRFGTTNEKLLSAKKIYACDLGIKHLFVGNRDLGSYFENYIYLMLKTRKELYYLYQDGVEIDFYTGDGVIIESKYGRAMTDKQKILFSNFPATKRILIDSVKNLTLLDAL